MRILAFCFFPAFVPASNGGQSRLFNFYRALSRWHHVTLLTSTHPGGGEEVVRHGLAFVERRIPKDNYFAQQYAVLDEHSGGGDLSGPAIAACGHLPTLLHQAYLDEYDNADVIIHDDPFTSAYDLFAGLDEKPRIYNSYNCESRLYRQLHPGKRSRPIHDIVDHAEARLVAQADLVLYCNEGDLAAFREMAPNANFDSLYAPNGMTPHAVPSNTSSREGRHFSAVFMGSGHPPNVRAAEFVALSLAPQLPEITFDILGSCLKEGGRFPPNVRRHGAVTNEQKTQILYGAKLALNPMAAGSGSNVKVLDYFSHGLPVLSTSFGMRGIQATAGTEYLEAELDGFAEAIRSIAVEPKAVAGVAAAGKALAIERYTWDAIASSSARAIEKLGRAKAANRKRFVLALNDYDSFQETGGGGTRTRGLYAAVSEWCPVVFVSFSGDGRLQARNPVDGITVINVPKSPEHLAEVQNVNAQFHVSADDIVAGRHCLSNPYLNAIYKTLKRSARCIVVEHCYLAGLPAAWGDRFVYSSQNCETELKMRLLEWHPLKAELLKDVFPGRCRMPGERKACGGSINRRTKWSHTSGSRPRGGKGRGRIGCEDIGAIRRVRRLRAYAQRRGCAIHRGTTCAFVQERAVPSAGFRVQRGFEGTGECPVVGGGGRRHEKRIDAVLRAGDKSHAIWQRVEREARGLPGERPVCCDHRIRAARLSPFDRRSCGSRSDRPFSRRRSQDIGRSRSPFGGSQARKASVVRPGTRHARTGEAICLRATETGSAEEEAALRDLSLHSSPPGRRGDFCRKAAQGVGRQWAIRCGRSCAGDQRDTQLLAVWRDVFLRWGMWRSSGHSEPSIRPLSGCLSQSCVHGGMPEACLERAARIRPGSEPHSCQCLRHDRLVLGVELPGERGSQGRALGIHGMQRLSGRVNGAGNRRLRASALRDYRVSRTGRCCWSGRRRGRLPPSGS